MAKKSFSILFEDDDIIVCNKAAGIPSIPGRDGKRSLKSFLNLKYGEIFTVHRLDIETSGTILFAKNPESHRTLSLSFQNREVSKIYHGLVRGVPASSGKIEVFLEENSKGKMHVRSRGKYSLSHFELLESWKNISLVKIKIETGRKHQIRAHMEYLGTPLLVDSIYGGLKAFYLSDIKKGTFNLKKDKEERALFSRVSLHASTLSIKHPVSQKSMHFESEFPKDFKATINQLNKLTR